MAVDRTAVWPGTVYGETPPRICDLPDGRLLAICRLFEWGSYPDWRHYAPAVAAELERRGWRRPGPARVRLAPVTTYAQFYAWSAATPANSWDYLRLCLDGRDLRALARGVWSGTTPPYVWADWLEERHDRLRRRPEKILFLVRALRAGL
jgi:hypothetical protein